MALDLIADFGKHQKAIYRYVQERKEGYFNSDCHQRLNRRVERLKDSYNLKIGSGNWKSKIVLPVVKEQMRLCRALTMQYFRPDPPISLEPILDTSYENAVNGQLVLNMNLKATEWRPRVWRPMVNSASIVGTAVEFAYYYEDESIVKRTVSDAFGFNQRVAVPKLVQQVRHDNLDVLNYFQNPTVLDPDLSDFQGHIDTVLVSELVNAYNNQPDVYIRENLAKVIKQARAGGIERDPRLHTDNLKDRDENRMGLDRSRFFGQINIKGNEDDDTVYYVEWIGDTIIRMQADLYDAGIKPYAIFNYEKRYDFWWGNLDSESLLPHEAYLNLLLSISADSALQSTQRIRLFQKGRIDVSAINNMAINNGFVPVDNLGMNEKLSDLVQELQYNERSLQPTEYMSREVKESMQRMSMKPDLSRTALQGGAQNKTATAANNIQQQSDMMAGDFLESFSGGLCKQGKIDMIILQQMLDGDIIVRPDIKQRSKVLRKGNIIGDFDYLPKTSLQTNTVAQGQKLLADITQLINFKGTGIPELAAINVVKIVRNFIKTMELPEDIDEILPENAKFAQPGAQPSAQPKEAQAMGRAQVQSAGIPQPGAMNVAA
ncbi:conserved hypothetical protein [Gammaproteobacteria bacterium]